jgi:hypothetical protein
MHHINKRIQQILWTHASATRLKGYVARWDTGARLYGLSATRLDSIVNEPRK